MLTDKQKRFAQEYIIDLNATQAAIRAGYSPRNARKIGHQTLVSPDVEELISELLRPRVEKAELSTDRVLAEMRIMAFYDPADFCAVSVEVEPGKFVVEGITSPAHIAALAENVRRAIVGWGYDRNGNFMIKLADKARALEQLGRHLSLFHDRVDVGGMDGLGDRIEEAFERLRRAEAESSRTTIHNPHLIGKTS